MTQGSDGAAGWEGVESAVGTEVRRISDETLDSYALHHEYIDEHFGVERQIREGGYGHRQLYELIQNGADALLRAGAMGRIEVVLTSDAVYCANEGAPIDADGVVAMLGSHNSKKRGDEIGRFGLGFKSVLSVTSNPEVYSRTGSFRFSAARAKVLINQRVPGVERTPVLRVAAPVDPLLSFVDDPVLGAMAEWASTIIKLPRDVGIADGASDVDLAQQVFDFKSEFLLFCPHVTTLVLTDAEAGMKAADRRELTLEKDGTYLMLGAEDNLSAWRVFSRAHVLSDAVKPDSDEEASRDEVQLSWAIRTPPSRQRGEFWAYFPTEDRTTLNGIINAPWKTNEDRQNLLRGDYNRELISASAELVADTLSGLASPDDPGCALDLLPGRGREADRFGDEFLTEQCYAKAAQRPSLPDSAGLYVVPSSLNLYPRDLPEEAHALWLERPGGPPAGWVHPSVDSRERRPRAEALVERGGGRFASVAAWLEALVDPSRPETSGHALRVAALLADVDVGHKDAAIVLTAGGRLAPIDPTRVFIATSHFPKAAQGISYLHPDLAADEAVVAAALVLGIEHMDRTQELRSLLGTEGPLDWHKVWRLAGGLDAEEAFQTLEDSGIPIHVRTRDNAFAPIRSALLPGEIIRGDEGGAGAIDVEFHGGQIDLLRALGAVSEPQRGPGPENVEGLPWWNDYRAHIADTGVPGRPDTASPDYVGPLAPLSRLDDLGALRFSMALVQLLEESPLLAVAGGTVPQPGWWALQEHGVLETSAGPAQVSGCVTSDLDPTGRFLPVPVLRDSVLARLGIDGDPARPTSSAWAQALERATGDSDIAAVEAFYLRAASCGAEAPPRVLARRGGGRTVLPPSQVVVARRPLHVETLTASEIPYLSLQSAEQDIVDVLVGRWGFQRAEDMITVQVVHTPVAAPVPMLDEFTALKRYGPEGVDTWTLVRCSEIRLERQTPLGRDDELAVVHVDDAGVVYAVEDLDDRTLIRRIGEHTGIHLSEATLDQILEKKSTIKRRQIRAAVRAAEGDADKLSALAAAGSLRRGLPRGLVETYTASHGEPSQRVLAQMFLAVHGTGSLQALRDQLDAEGLEPPRQWAGSAPALEFVRDLGFDQAFAGEPGISRTPFERVLRPPELPPLHDYQRTIADRIKRHLGEPKRDRRGLVSLPTGAGKTRVAVQALIEHVVETESSTGTYLWVANGDELCEQAMGTWEYVWREIGPRGVPVKLSRLWASNDARPPESGWHVVVATIQKLTAVIDRGDDAYEWLRSPDCLVIDEAHGSTERSYTALLNWVGNDARAGKFRTTLAGLTATPFRGRSEEETDRLVRRYGGNRFDDKTLGDDPYDTLQRMGVLAGVRHEKLDGSNLSLDHGERVELERFDRVPSSLSKRIADDGERNQTIVRSISGLPSAFTVIVFAASVAHAQTLAALLQLEGIPARPIWGEGNPAARRRHIELFQAGEIRVLTNYDVFSEGFDAPKVSAVYITRPVFTPGRYQQMIGRGLRGPLNGGKEECLIVDVADNFLQFDGELAFTKFEHLWKQGTTA